MGKRPREEACAICGHYHDYEGGEPCSICGHVLGGGTVYDMAVAFPANIVPDFLYLGDFDLASRRNLLHEMQITHILVVTEACPELYGTEFTYWRSSTKEPDFRECFEVLEAWRSQSQKVLVHCMSGTSRSPAVVIGWLMSQQRGTMQECAVHVQSLWRKCKLTQGDERRLLVLEQELAKRL